MKKEIGMFILLVVLCGIVALINPQFVSVTNLQHMARYIGAFGIFSIGAGIVIITGGIDLSVGSVLALLGVVLSIFLTKHGVPSPVAVLAVIAIGMGLGALNGLLITRVGVLPFIVTLCGMLFYRGMAQFIAHDETQGFGESGFNWLHRLGTGSVFGIPSSFVLLVFISAVMWFVLHRSVYGRYLFAVGRNEVATRYSGINTKLVICSAYVLAGLLTGVSAIVFAFATSSVQASTDDMSYELYGIAAAVLGGCSLRGGEGSIVGILIGTALLQVLQNLGNLLGIPSSLIPAVMGAVILIGVIADQVLQRRGKTAAT